jgi:hypothetical protein
MEPLRRPGRLGVAEADDENCTGIPVEASGGELRNACPHVGPETSFAGTGVDGTAASPGARLLTTWNTGGACRKSEEVTRRGRVAKLLPRQSAAAWDVRWAAGKLRDSGED